MAGVVSLAEPRSSLSRAHGTWNHHLFLQLLAPALLLGLWRVWSSTAAPRLGVYFTAEAVLMAYAYFSLVRAVHRHVHSYDSEGRYSSELALRAGREFFHALRRYWLKIAVVLLALMVIALNLDVLTVGTGIQHRPNVHISILFVEIMAWARYGAAVVITAAHWSSPRPVAFAQARKMAEGTEIARSFALTNLAFGAVALVAIAGYKWGGGLLPSGRTELFCSVGLFAGLALLALWLHCRWATHIASQIAGKNALDKRVSVMRRAA